MQILRFIAANTLAYMRPGHAAPFCTAFGVVAVVFGAWSVLLGVFGGV